MMTASAVTQEAARMGTRQQIERADAYRASRTDEAARKRRAPWTMIASAIRARSATTAPIPQAQPVTTI